jgi:hypothetical protein
MALLMNRAQQMIRFEMYEHLRVALDHCRKYKKVKETIALFPPGVDAENLAVQLDSIYTQAIEQVGIATGLGLGILYLTEDAKGEYDVDLVKPAARRISLVRSIIHKACYE